MNHAEVIQKGSKSFALASRILPPRERRLAQALYAWCRDADDAVDRAATPEQAMRELARLRAELADVYAGRPVTGAAAALRQVVEATGLPAELPEAMLAGFQMDAEGVVYHTADELHLYCHRVAGVVGLMMCRAFGVTDPAALAHAEQLGRAMQLTNIARDVAEDWQRGRLYLPRAWLTQVPQPGDPLDDAALRPAVRELLRLARGLYEEGERGLAYLPPRTRLAVAVASRVYAEIGAQVAARDYAVSHGRAVVPTRRKLALVASAAWRTLTG